MEITATPVRGVCPSQTGNPLVTQSNQCGGSIGGTVRLLCARGI